MGEYPWLLLPESWSCLKPNAHSPAMRVLCCRACSSSSTCCSRDACPWGLVSPSSATPSRQPGMEDVLMNLPVSVPPCRRDWRACLSASCCVDSFGEAWGWGKEMEMRERVILPQSCCSPPQLWEGPSDLPQGLGRTKAPARGI